MADSTLSELNADRLDATKAASDQARPFALAGVATVWLFTGPYFRDGTADPPSRLLLAAGILFAIGLAADLIQLIARALILDAIYNDREATSVAQTAISEGQDPIVQELGTSLAKVTKCFWIFKLFALAVGYALVVAFFVYRFFAPI